MKCKLARKLLSPYLDGELEPSAKNSLLNHLRICPPCRRELEELETVGQVLRCLPELTPAPGFRTQLRERLAREQALFGQGQNLDQVTRTDRERESRAQTGSDTPPQYIAKPDGEWERQPGHRVSDGSTFRLQDAKEQPSRRAGIRAAASLFFAGAKVWPKLAVVATLLVAVGIASFWYSPAKPERSPEQAREQVADSLTQKGKGSSLDADLKLDLPTETTALEKAGQTPELIAGPPGEKNRLRVEGYSTASGENTINEKTKGTSAQPSFESKGRPAEDKEKGVEALPQETAPPVKMPAPLAAAASAGEETGTPPKKVTRQVIIKLKVWDGERVALALSRFGQGKEQAVEKDTSQEYNTLRIKVALSQMPEFIEEVKSLGVILKQEEISQDITADYYNRTKRLKQLEEREKILLAQEKSSRREDAETTLLQEIKKIRTDLAIIKEELLKMDEDANPNLILVKIYWPE